MFPYKTKRGFSPVLIIVIILILGALGVGGYFGYTMYLEPMLNPYAKLIPDGLKDYAKGENAAVFAILKIDKEIQEQISKIPQTNVLNFLSGGIILANVEDDSVIAHFIFTSADGANSTKLALDSLLENSPFPIKTEQKDKILTMSLGKGQSAFTGSLLDNPNMKNLDSKLLDSQFILFLDGSKSPDLSTFGYTIINTIFGGAGYGIEANNPKSIFPGITSSHAQGLIMDETSPATVPQWTGGTVSPRQQALATLNGMLNFVKYTSVYIRLKDQTISIITNIRILEKDKIADSPIMKLMKQMKPDVDVSEFEKVYDDFEKNMPDSLKEMQKTLDDAKSKTSGMEGKIGFTGNTLSLEISIPVSVLEKKIQEMTSAQLSAPAKGRDAARKAYLDATMTAIEAYNLEKDKYPEKSACFEDLEATLKDYVYKGKISTDPSGPQTFGTITCQNGFYYQTFGDNGYILWAKMDLPENGNTMLTPDELKKTISAGNTPTPENSGTYYIKNETSISSKGTSTITPASTTTSKPKVKRGSL